MKDDVNQALNAALWLNEVFHITLDLRFYYEACRIHGALGYMFAHGLR